MSVPRKAEAAVEGELAVSASDTKLQQEEGHSLLSGPYKPMTYSQLLESGLGDSLPDALWVPYIATSAEPTSSQRKLRSSSHMESGNPTMRKASEKHRRPMSNSMAEELGHEKKGSISGDAHKKGRPTQKSKVSIAIS